MEGIREMVVGLLLEFVSRDFGFVLIKKESADLGRMDRRNTMDVVQYNLTINNTKFY
jgi:hypothetical protein